MSTTDNKSLVRQFIQDVWNDQQYDRIDDLYRPDYVGHWFLPGGVDGDRDALKAFIQSVHEGFPDLEMTTEFLHGEDDLVTVGFTSHGTHEGEFMGIPPSDDPPEVRPIPGHVTARFVDGEVVESWATWDALGLFQGLGVIPEDFEQVAVAAED